MRSGSRPALLGPYLGPAVRKLALAGGHVGLGSEGGQVVACLPEAYDGALPVTGPAQAAAVIAFQQGELEGQGQARGQLPGGGEGFLGTGQVALEDGQVSAQASRRHAR